jgi:hypothetical protein
MTSSTQTVEIDDTRPTQGLVQRWRRMLCARAAAPFRDEREASEWTARLLVPAALCEINGDAPSVILFRNPAAEHVAAFPAVNGHPVSAVDRAHTGQAQIDRFRQGLLTQGHSTMVIAFAGAGYAQVLAQRVRLHESDRFLYVALVMLLNEMPG